MDNISFFQLFSSGLQQKLNDNEEILGYLKTDIDAELKRASKLVRMLWFSKHVYWLIISISVKSTKNVFFPQTCFYCKLRGASIGCDRRACRKSFQFPCGLENRCLAEFHGNYRSFCHLHHKIERLTIHDDNELCVLCNESMGKFHPVTSVELSCCGTKWIHKKCLQHSVYKQNTPRCTTCGDEEQFRYCLQSNGIFVPER